MLRAASGSAGWFQPRNTRLIGDDIEKAILSCTFVSLALSCPAPLASRKSERIIPGTYRAFSREPDAKNSPAADANDQTVSDCDDGVRVADFLAIMADGHSALLHQSARFIS